MNISYRPKLVAHFLVTPVLLAPPFSSEASQANAADMGHAQTVKIALVTTLTGNAAHLGKDEENGARMAVDDINAKGIVVGAKRIRIELLVENDAGDPRTATAVAQRVVDQGAVAIVGHMNSGTSIPASRVYSEAGIAQITPSATNPLLTRQGFTTTFRVVATDDAQGPVLADYAYTRLHARRVAVIDDSSAYGVGLADRFARAAQGHGIQIISRDAATDHTVDFRALLTRIKASRPDALVFGGMDETGALLLRQATSLSLNVPVIAGDGLCGQDFGKLAGPSAHRVVCSIAGSAIGSSAAGRDFQANYTNRYGQPVLGYAPFAYDAIRVIANAITQAGSTAPQAVLSAVRQTNYPGITGHIQFDRYGDLRNPTVSIYGYEGVARILKEQKLETGNH
ncbi:branched-chain amino acid transport system substrate-binding protein [Burkholderia multivorans]